MTESIQQTTGIPSYEEYLKSQAVRTAKTDLDRSAFLKLMTASLQYQDPLEPQKDTDFIAQLAQFNSLMQMETLNQTMSLYTSYGMVGKFAVAVYRDENNLDVSVAGVIDRVFTKDKVVYAQIGDHIFEASRITDVFDAGDPAASAASDATNLLLENLTAYNLVGKTVVAEISNPDFQPEEIANPMYDPSQASRDGEPYEVQPTIRNPNWSYDQWQRLGDAYTVDDWIPNPEYKKHTGIDGTLGAAPFTVQPTIPNPDYDPGAIVEPWLKYEGVVDSVSRNEQGVVCVSIRLIGEDGKPLTDDEGKPVTKTFPASEVMTVKATQGSGVEDLLAEILKTLTPAVPDAADDETPAEGDAPAPTI
ncbi:MAG: hypothetical protein LBC65_04340 [Oscillospiraceae bacterium]|jgi:hypothetical protein|nr:hypothetical protein [Oscillospiraceae bacterium]